MARLRIAALPVAIAGCGVLLVCGGFTSRALWPWLVVIGAAIGAVARWGLEERTLGRESVENGGSTSSQRPPPRPRRESSAWSRRLNRRPIRAVPLSWEA